MLSFTKKAIKTLQICYLPYQLEYLDFAHERKVLERALLFYEALAQEYIAHKQPPL